MPTTTVTVPQAITTTWTKVSDSSCIFQDSAFTSRLFRVYVGDTPPTPDTLGVRLPLDHLKTFDLKSPVWVRLSKTKTAPGIVNNLAQSATLVVIKQVTTP